ncbi:hypothetical protein ACU4GD_19395 [Cupriavidus basilensis]
MVWQDTRYVSELNALAPAWDKTLIEQVGRPAGVRSPYLWAARHLHADPGRGRGVPGEPSCVRHDRYLAAVATCPGERTCVTTPTNVTSASSACELAEHRYPPRLAGRAGLSCRALAGAAPGRGRLRPHPAGATGHRQLPILACAGDQPRGRGGGFRSALDRGQSMCVHGTGSFVDLMTGPEPPARAGLLRRHPRP